MFFLSIYIRSRGLISAMAFGEQTGMPYSRRGRMNTPYDGMKCDFERFGRSIVQLNLQVQRTSSGDDEGNCVYN